MIGRLIRLAVLVLVLLGVWRVGEAYLAHYRFADEVDQIAQRGLHAAAEDLRAAVVEASVRYAIPVKPDDIAVRVQGERAYIDLKYVRQVEVFPRYLYPWPFETHAQGWEVASGGLKKR